MSSMTCTMERSPHFPHDHDSQHISTSTSQSQEAFNASIPLHQPFETPDGQSKAHGGPYMQSWWGGNELNFSMNYSFPVVYQDNLPPWDSGAPSISRPQSLRSSITDSLPGLGCFTSPPLRDEDIPIVIAGEQSVDPDPNGLGNIDQSPYIPSSQLLGVPLTYEPDFEAWDGSQSGRHITPESQWSGPLHANARESPQLQTRSQRRHSSASGVRKSLGKRASSVPGRSPRHKRLTSFSQGDSISSRVFICSFAPYGCESTFVSKNEWKRHITSQHLQLGFYRCDVGKCSLQPYPPSSNHLSQPSTSTSLTPKGTSLPTTVSAAQPNDFNRKDLFTQHQRRMHAPWLTGGQKRTPTNEQHASFESSLEQVRQRCWHELRQPPKQSRCGFCSEVFSGEGSWEIRMEHVGRHFERDERLSLGEEVEDLSLREWALQQGILMDVHGECRLASLVREEGNTS